MTPVFSAYLLDALQPRDAIVLALVVGHAAAVSGKRDHVRSLGFSRFGDVVAHLLFQAVMVFLAVPRHRDGPRPGSHSWS